jgi:hypothetical protein
MSLKQYIAQQNRFASLWGQTANEIYPENPALLNSEQKTRIASRLASDLSPENLCCDGELRGAQLRAKTKLLNDAKKELAGMGVTHEWW